MDKGLFDNLALELGSSGGVFDKLELGLDKWARAIGSSTVHWHSWEQYSYRELEFGKVEGNLGTWGKILEIWGWTLVRQNLIIWIGGGSIVVVGMIAFR